MLSTYSITTMLINVMNLKEENINLSPIEILNFFFEYYCSFDFSKPIQIETTNNSIIKEEFLKKWRLISEDAPFFKQKYLNIIDPLRPKNNIGKCVSNFNFHRIRQTFKKGFEDLRNILNENEDISSLLSKFFKNTWEQYKGDYHLYTSKITSPRELIHLESDLKFSKIIQRMMLKQKEDSAKIKDEFEINMKNLNFNQLNIGQENNEKKFENKNYQTITNSTSIRSSNDVSNGGGSNGDIKDDNDGGDDGRGNNNNNNNSSIDGVGNNHFHRTNTTNGENKNNSQNHYHHQYQIKKGKGKGNYLKKREKLKSVEKIENSNQQNLNEKKNESKNQILKKKNMKKIK